jgi:secondary thiamine-phosphate synthase enzyme
MDTLATATICLHETVSIETRCRTGFVDLTPQLEQIVAASRIRVGTVHVQTRHTTSAVIVNEHEPLLLADMLAMLERLAPAGAFYAHDDLAARANVPPDEPLNGSAHCRALLLPCSVTLNIARRRMALGRWQRVLFLELDGPRRRDVSVVLTGEVSL